MPLKEIELGREYLVYDQCYLRKVTAIERTAPDKDEWLCADDYSSLLKFKSNVFLVAVNSARSQVALCASS